MKRNFLFLTAIMSVLGCMLSAAEPTIKKPFNGTNLDGWKFKAENRENCWKVGTFEANATVMVAQPLKDGEKGFMVNAVGAGWREAKPAKGVDIYTDETFGDCTVKLEFLITKGSNSGVYLLGEYEVQIADSFGKADDKLGQGDLGAIYSAAKPLTNATTEPGTWQNFEIEFVAPKFDGNGNKIAFAVFKKITLNGKIVQENVEVKGPTGGGLTMKEAATGPLMLQGNHGPVAFRNIEIRLSPENIVPVPR